MGVEEGMIVELGGAIVDEGCTITEDVRMSIADEVVISEGVGVTETSMVIEVAVAFKINDEVAFRDGVSLATIVEVASGVGVGVKETSVDMSEEKMNIRTMKTRIFSEIHS